MFRLLKIYSFRFHWKLRIENWKLPDYAQIKDKKISGKKSEGDWKKKGIAKKNQSESF